MTLLLTLTLTLTPSQAALASARLDAAAAPRLAEAIGLLQVCWLSRCQPLPAPPAALVAPAAAISAGRYPAAAANSAGEATAAVAAAFGTVLRDRVRVQTLTLSLIQPNLA